MRKIIGGLWISLEFTWRNSEQLQGDLVDFVTALKNEPGGNIGLSGSVSVVRQLLDAGLLDELHLLVHPIAVRKGMRLFDEGEASIPLRLISSETFQTGVLNLVYGPAESTGDGTYEEAKQHLPQTDQWRGRSARSAFEVAPLAHRPEDAVGGGRRLERDGVGVLRGAGGGRELPDPVQGVARR